MPGSRTDSGVDAASCRVHFADVDGDGFGDVDAPLAECATDGVTNSADCDDVRSDAYPGATEVCGDGLDQDCDRVVDNACPCTDGDTQPCGTDTNVGACEYGVQTCLEGIWSTCLGATTPVAEVCDAVDNDCDGEADEAPETAACSLPNATAVCGPGGCRVAECSPGYGDCNLLASDGCEQDTSKMACGEDCSGATCIDPGVGWRGVYLAYEHSCAIKASDRVVYCWGENSGKQALMMTDSLTPIAVAALSDARSIAFADSGDGIVYGSQTCALRSGGELYCSGLNYLGQVGNGSMATDYTAASRVDLGEAVVQVEAGPDFTCARTMSGSVYCWGSDLYGQLGDGDVAHLDPPYSATPVAVPGIVGAVSISVANAQACAALADGHVECWGYNGSGQLGDGTNEDRHAPVRVLDLIDVVEVSLGDWHGCGRTASGSVACWGSMGGADSGTAALAAGVDDAIAVSSGGSHSCVVHLGGTVSCWGGNNRGKLGTGTTEPAALPTLVDGITDAVAVATGYSHTCVLHLTGDLSCWGDNRKGEVGDGTREQRSSPVAVVAGPSVD